MNEAQLIMKANEWIESLKGTKHEMYFKFTTEELIQIGKNLIANSK